MKRIKLRAEVLFYSFTFTVKIDLDQNRQEQQLKTRKERLFYLQHLLRQADF